MNSEKVAPLLEGVFDKEEMKLNLRLAGADYKLRRYGKVEAIVVQCEDGNFLVTKSGSLKKISERGTKA